jgi:hypothetical protein
MSMGAIWLLFIAWSYTALPVVKSRGSMSGGESLPKIEERYEDLKSYCMALGLASGKEGITPERKTTLFVGEHSDLSNIQSIELTSFARRSSRTFIQTKVYIS